MIESDRPAWKLDRHKVPAGLSPERAWRWCVMRTNRDARIAKRNGRPIASHHLARVFARRWHEVLVREIGPTMVFAKTTRQALYREGFNVTQNDFAIVFRELTGNPPLSWQTRLYDKHFAKGDLPSVIDLPTGLGKTMVMAVWLIARLHHPDRIPTRLIYVVDRRTVVDQATDLAEELAYLLSAHPHKSYPHVEKRRPELVGRWKNLGESRRLLGQNLAVSTLRGQLADNREWSRDPSRPAIIIGTVDLIGSALLFSGYRSGFKTKPLHAGMLGQDSLLVLDEAHLSKPFEKLICAINDNGPFQKDYNGNTCGKPMQVMRMSATSDGDSKDRFKLEDADFVPEVLDLAGNLVANPIVERINAKKRLTITTIAEKDDVNKKLAEVAIELAHKPDLIGKRIVIFVRKPDDATKIAKAIREHTIESVDESGSKPKKIKKTPHSESVEVLTGTMRGLERDKLVEKSIFKDRWLNGKLDPSDPTNQQPVFLISTSAGEVGFDLNADHLIGDAAPLDSWIQRLGRVNRRGKGSALVYIFAETPAAKKADKKDDANKQTVASASIKSILALKQLPIAEPLETDARSGLIWDASPRALGNLSKPADALSPPVATVDLTDILLDAWSMTSITAPMPGRPEVATWLRGIADDIPQTTIAWRAELDLFKDNLDPQKAFKAIFAKHPIRPHESVTVNSYRAVEFFNQVKKKRADLLGTRIVIKLSRDIVVRTIQQIIDNDGILNADPTLILPATFGGLEKGMLSHEAISAAPEPESPSPSSLDVADREGYEQTEGARARLRILIERTDDEWKAARLPGGSEIPADLELGSRYEKSTQLFNDLKKQDFRVRLVQPVKFDDESDAIMSLVVLAPTVRGKKPVDQSLVQHVKAVCDEAKRIADALQLMDSIRSALLFAAKWHDEGKKADIWQYFIGHESGEPLGKGASPRDPKSLKGYRHEFGSLLRIQHPNRFNTVGCISPIDADARDLALHLIATHHGMGRPHFDNALYAQFTDEERDTLLIDSIRRFARLQKQYGHWRLAWLENLLRCADAIASAQAGSTGEEDETEEA